MGAETLLKARSFSGAQERVPALNPSQLDADPPIDWNDLEALRAAQPALGTTLNAIVREADFLESVAYFRLYSAEISDGSRVHLVIQTPGNSKPRAGVAQVTTKKGLTDVWVFPTDPELPLLPVAVHPQAAQRYLDSTGHPGQVGSVEVISYHPGVRAVTRIGTDGRGYIAKVIRPATVTRTVSAIRAWRSHLHIVPEVLAYSRDGLLLMPNIIGIAGDDALASGNCTISMIDRAWDLLDSFPSDVNYMGASRTPTQMLESTGSDLVKNGLLTSTDYESLSSWMNCKNFTPAEPKQLRHGDFHLGQLLFNETQIVGLLDVDSPSIASSAEDAGRFWAHLVAFADSGSQHAAVTMKLADGWAEKWQTKSSGYLELARRYGVCSLLTHALGTPGAGPDSPPGRMIERAKRLIHDWLPTVAS